MNLYVRYFSHETLAKSVDEALDFLATIPEIRIENNTRSRISTFLRSSNLYPFRLKVTFSNYVLFLKTEAESLEAFKEEEAIRRAQKSEQNNGINDRKKTIMDALNTPKRGWWLTSIKFKRVITMPHTGKCQYVDTTFTVKQIADSAMDAYNRIIDHLKHRIDVDIRSQFPSAKSANFEYKFIEELSDNESHNAQDSSSSEGTVFDATSEPDMHTDNPSNADEQPVSNEGYINYAQNEDNEQY